MGVKRKSKEIAMKMPSDLYRIYKTELFASPSILRSSFFRFRLNWLQFNFHGCVCACARGCYFVSIRMCKHNTLIALVVYIFLPLFESFASFRCRYSLVDCYKMLLMMMIVMTVPLLTMCTCLTRYFRFSFSYLK